MTDLVTFGETMLRLSPPDQERLETADQYDVHVAGAESNVAVAAQRLGLDAAWLSKLPDSPVGRRVTGELRRHDVAIEVCWDDEDGRQGTYYLEQGDVPRGNEVIYDRADASVTTLRTEEVPEGLVEDAGAVHTSGITPALSETLEATTADLLSRANDAGTTTCFDMNYRSKLWSPSEAKAVVTELFPDIDVLVVAHRDAEQVLERAGDATEVAASLTDDYDFDVTVVTRGAEGVVAATADEQFAQDPFEASDAHPVGSGDSFVGGFLSQYLTNGSVADGLEWGAATAALKRSVPGDIAVVSPGEIRELIQGETAEISR
ncbi:bifunctional 2-dehydro-3-deoxygluconokinase/2-dehydro-3-deoxygalactonokinase [Haloarcula pelagica]|uniref:bifunctional 2-dehydro-3-deoxygluconokinase/2-dehydro-3- deoxygalactonokinase n=1 Tax=Haloarcula pelagica TaxID=3033389 RepID=UPI0024C363FF|nr:bifunctional 2-dehydro-3-deoxygluconokinase/2-dehydro-3-deoxygalactonokinase [Halomicroarcula sp. YJ-61-S]